MKRDEEEKIEEKNSRRKREGTKTHTNTEWVIEITLLFVFLSRLHTQKPWPIFWSGSFHYEDNIYSRRIGGFECLVFVVVVVVLALDRLTTVKFVAGFWAVDVAVATAFHWDARAVLARELPVWTLGPFFTVDNMTLFIEQTSCLYIVNRQDYSWLDLIILVQMM